MIIGGASEAKQHLVRADQSDNVNQRAAGEQENNAIKAVRSVETAADSSKADTNVQDKPSGKNVRDGDKIVYEKYDKNGNVVLRLPPESINENA